MQRMSAQYRSSRLHISLIHRIATIIPTIRGERHSWRGAAERGSEGGSSEHCDRHTAAEGGHEGWLSAHLCSHHPRSRVLPVSSGGSACGGHGGELARPSVKDPHSVLPIWHKDHLQRATPRSGHHHHSQPRPPSLSHSQSQGHFRSHSSLSFISRSATIITIARDHNRGEVEQREGPGQDERAS